MGSKVDLYLKRAMSELEIAGILEKISYDKDVKLQFNLSEESTYFSGVISHAYYCIFYSAKAMLLSKNVDTKSPNIHQKTLDAFKTEFIDTGILDARLFVIYKEMIIKAETLLALFRTEKRKRGDYTYNTIAQANADPAKESICNAKEFVKHTNTYLLNKIKFI